MSVNGTISEKFVLNVGVHQGSLLSPLLFIMILEVLLCEFRSGCPYYYYTLVTEKLRNGKKVWRQRVLQTNMKKKKIMVSVCDSGSVRSSGKWACSIYNSW